MAGGMMRFGIPKYRLPRDVLDAEVRRIVDLGVELKLNRKVANILDDDARGRFRRRLPRGRCAHCASAPTSRPARRRTCSMRYRSCAAWKARTSRCSGAVSSSTAAAIRRWTSRAPPSAWVTEPIIVYRRTREKMPAHDFEVEEALAEGVLIKWLSTIRNVDDSGTITVEKMALDDKGFPQPTGEFETLEADSLVLALGQDVDLSLLDRCRAWRSRTASCRSRRT